MSNDRIDGRDAGFGGEQDPRDIACAFCGKAPHQVSAMISGPGGIYICDECISVCADAMMRDMGASNAGEYESPAPAAYGRGAGTGRHARPVQPFLALIIRRAKGINRFIQQIQILKAIRSVMVDICGF